MKDLNDCNLIKSLLHMNSYPYTTYDIESGRSIELLRREFITFKDKMTKEIYEIRKVTHPPSLILWFYRIYGWGFIASYIILWLIVFHIM
jgi:hypothetical protein